MIKIRLLYRKRPERTKPLLGMSSGFFICISEPFGKRKRYTTVTNNNRM